MTKHLLRGGLLGASLFGASLLLAACGGAEGTDSQATDAAPAASASGAASGAVTPDAGGRIIEVEMITDENGNYFRPADFEARKGDVIRYTLVQGVHNVHFLPDSNPGARNLPPMGPMLQLPGQTTDVKVEWEPGTYFYQCDPHALLGMVGRVTVTP